ncbi:hypothetical protein TNCV_2989541 [Trichonephila clavipes]|nr:hypothetical protein TNCV_2989541 [Trichonephila clavipes]
MMDIMESMRIYLEAHSNGEMNNKIDEIEQTADNLMLKRQCKERHQASAKGIIAIPRLFIPSPSRGDCERWNCTRNPQDIVNRSHQFPAELPVSTMHCRDKFTKSYHTSESLRIGLITDDHNL